MSFFTVTEFGSNKKFDINYFHVIGMAECDQGTEIICRDNFKLMARENIDKVAEMMMIARRRSKIDEHRIRIDRKERTMGNHRLP